MCPENQSDKEGQRRRVRQEDCPVSSVQPALLIYQIVSSLSVPGDQPVRPLAQGPGRSGYINTSAAFVLVLTPCFSAQANRPLATSLQRSRTPLSPQSIKTATEASLFPAGEDCFSAYAAMKGRNYPRQTQKGGTQLNNGGNSEWRRNFFLSFTFKIHQFLMEGALWNWPAS